MYTADPRLEYVPPPGWSWLAAVIRDLKGDDPFQPVTIVVPNEYAGHQAQAYLARDGGYLNLRVARLSRLADRCAPPGSRGSLSAAVEGSAVRAALRISGGAFAQVDHASLRRSLREQFRELRRGEVEPSELPPTTTAAARATLEVYATFRRLIEGYDTPTSRADAAASRLTEATELPRALAQLGPLVLFLPTRLDPADARFLAAAARWVPLVAAFPWFGDPSELGDQPARDDAGRLARALGIRAPDPESTPFAPPPLRIVRAPDPAEEVREVVRAIARDLEDGITFDRIGVVYRDDDPYAGLIRDGLDAAGFPWISSEGTRLGDTRPGRCLLDLLALPERAFTRESVLQWLGTGPLLTGAIAAVPIGSWDRLSRQAGVTRGPKQWESRLRRHATSLEEAAGRDDDGTASARASLNRREAADARAIADFIAALAKALEPPPSNWRWADYVNWAIDRYSRLVGSRSSWPEPWRDSANAIEAAIRELEAGDGLEAAPGLAGFLEAIRDGLMSSRLRPGRPGDGIIVEPLVAMMGLAVERLYLLGLREGAYPPPPSVNPFFPDEDCDPLHARSRQRAVERRDFLAGLTALHGDTARVTLGVPDSDESRPAFPAGWLLELASRQTGEQLDAERFRVLPDQAWLRVVRSAQDGVLRATAWADLEDRRLGELAGWRASGRALATQPLLHRLDLPLGAALRLARERESERFTRFDGNVADRVGARRLALDSAHPASSSAFETWATCGYRYFLSYVLGIEATTRPEEQLGLDPRDRGSLIHAILNEFFRALRQEERPRPDEAYTADDVAELEAIARRHLDLWEQIGTTGFVLTWESERAAILADLRLFLPSDARVRRDGRFLPRYFERPFGARDGFSWPPLDVALPDEPTLAPLRFRGILDRVDLDESGQRAWAYDYKTGSAEGYAGLERDPVLAGTHLQLALYRRVVKANLPEVTSVGASYWFVTSRAKFALQNVDDNARADERLDAVLATIVHGIRSGAFPAVPGALVWPSTFAHCRHCHYDRICPTQRGRFWRRKQTDPAAAIHGTLSIGTDGGEGTLE